MLQVGSGSVIPPVPLVSESQLVAMIWTRNRKAMVRITNEVPRARIATTPSSAARPPASRPAAGTHTNGLPPTSVARIPAV